MFLVLFKISAEIPKNEPNQTIPKTNPKTGTASITPKLFGDKQRDWSLSSAGLDFILMNIFEMGNNESHKFHWMLNRFSELGGVLFVCFNLENCFRLKFMGYILQRKENIKFRTGTQFTYSTLNVKSNAKTIKRGKTMPKRRFRIMKQKSRQLNSYNLHHTMSGIYIMSVRL